MRYLLVLPDYQSRWKDVELNLDQAPLSLDQKGKNLILEGTPDIWNKVVKKYKLVGDSKLLFGLLEPPGLDLERLIIHFFSGQKKE